MNILIDALEGVLKSLGTIEIDQDTRFGIPILFVRHNSHFLGPATFNGILTRDEADEAYRQHIDFLDTVGDQAIEKINRLKHADEKKDNYDHILESIEESREVYREIARAVSAKVYIIKCGDEYKIGYSSNPKNRMSGVTAPSSHGEKELLLTIDNDNPRDLEGFLHGVFDHKRISGEWFSLSDIDIEWIKQSIPYLEKKKFSEPWLII